MSDQDLEPVAATEWAQPSQPEQELRQQEQQHDTATGRILDPKYIDQETGEKSDRSEIVGEEFLPTSTHTNTSATVLTESEMYREKQQQQQQQQSQTMTGASTVSQNSKGSFKDRFRRKKGMPAPPLSAPPSASSKASDRKKHRAKRLSDERQRRSGHANKKGNGPSTKRSLSYSSREKVVDNIMASQIYPSSDDNSNDYSSVSSDNCSIPPPKNFNANSSDCDEYLTTPGAVRVQGSDYERDDGYISEGGIHDEYTSNTNNDNILFVADDNTTAPIIVAATTVEQQEKDAEALVANLQKQVQQQQNLISQQQEKNHHEKVPNPDHHKNTAVATAVPFAHAEDNADKPTNTKNPNQTFFQKWKVAIIVLVLIVVGAVTVSAVVANRNGNGNDGSIQSPDGTYETINSGAGSKTNEDMSSLNNDTDSILMETEVPSMAPSQKELHLLAEERLFSALQVLQDQTDFLHHIDEMAIRAKGTPEFEAIDWFARKDTISVEYFESRPEELLERFFVLILYASSGGFVKIGKRFPDLRQKGVHTCDWNDKGTGMGIFCNENNRIVAIDLYDEADGAALGIIGPLPTYIGLLPYLELFDCRGNELIGSIPSEFGTLSTLHELQLSKNSLTGVIPSHLGNINATLGTLHLEENPTLSSSIPTEIGNLQGLQSLRLGPGLVGTLPVELGKMSQLQEISIASNQNLSGFIPTEIQMLQQLEVLDLSFNPILSGTIPLQQLPMLHTVNIQNSTNIDIASTLEFCGTDADRLIVTSCISDIECSCCVSGCAGFAGN